MQDVIRTWPLNMYQITLQPYEMNSKLFGYSKERVKYLLIEELRKKGQLV